MDNNVFTVKNLSFAYGKQQVLKHLDLELHEEKITTLIGANGCGKSTLFNLMTKNLRPDEGGILLRGGDIAGMQRLKRISERSLYRPPVQHRAGGFERRKAGGIRKNTLSHHGAVP